MTPTLKSLLTRAALGAATLGLSLACGDGGKNSDATGAGSSGTAGTDATGSAGPTSTTGASSGGGGSSSGAPGSTSAPGTTTGPHTTGASSGATTEASTGTAGSSGGGESSSSGGEACEMHGGKCNEGQTCCPGLDCCAGIPIPPGAEFCSDNCPVSDRNLKTEFAAIDPAQVLARVVALPITSWRYKKDDAAVRHIGPMAQDFHAAFGLWNSDTMIFPLDASGVSMAAIQALHGRLLAAEAENEDLRARLERLERRLDATP